MPDFATSTNAAVQTQLDRLWALSPGADILGLERITALLARLGNPHERLPPVLHVAGTNGKGSTCAFLRAAIEAAGYTAHVYTSPHLVRFNERIRLAGKLIDDDHLATLLAEVLDQAEGIGASFFEVTTAAAFLAFSCVPADACIVEVGLGGRLDATNVIAHPLVTGIAQLGIDHQAFLGDTAEDIAAEKAGIAKPGVPLVTMRYPDSVAARIAAVARAAGAPWLPLGELWRFGVDGEQLVYDDTAGRVVTPLPVLAGSHQPENLALAIAMSRHQTVLPLSPQAFVAAAEAACWPARMQRLGRGPLTGMLPAGSAVWLDGGHNAAAGESIARTIASHILAEDPAASAATFLGGELSTKGVHLVFGMLANKDPEGLLGPLAPLIASFTAVPVPGHEHHKPDALADIARNLAMPTVSAASDVPTALRQLAAQADGQPIRVLILCSLYLAGSVLAANGQPPE